MLTTQDPCSGPHEDSFGNDLECHKKMDLKVFFFYMLECGSTSEVAVVIHIYLYFIECKFLMLNVKKKSFNMLRGS